MEGLQSLLVRFSETTFIITVPVVPRSSWVQDLVYHNFYKADHHSGLLISLGVMGQAQDKRRQESMEELIHVLQEQITPQ